MAQCWQIRNFSIAIFNHLTSVFSFGLSFSELGLTDHFVLEIAKNSHRLGLGGVEIYKVGWNVESLYGNDLDLFVENSSGTYNWYALQAKVMSSNGAYKDIKQKPIARQQWDKLLDHEADFGSKTYYLLYNGKYYGNDFQFNLTRTDCIGIPLIEELGMGIVETDIIRTLRAGMTPASNLYFRHVCPAHMDSIRKLFCCSPNLPPSKKQFTREEIKTDSYKKIYYTDNLKDIEKETSEIKFLPEGFAPIRIIISKTEEGD